MSYGRGYGGGSSGGFRDPPGPKPVEVGKEYEVEVIEVSREGDGVANIQGFGCICKKWNNGAKS